MRELTKEKGLWRALLITAIGIVIGIPFFSMKLPLSSGSFVTYFKTALCSKVVIFLLPVTAVLPMGAIYIKEASSGFIKLYITRTNRMEYLRIKIMQIYAGGSIIFLGAGLLVLVLCFLFLYPLEIRGEIPVEELKEALGILIRISMIGGILSGVSGIFAAIFQNYYMTYGLPFVSYYMLIILKERYFTDMYSMYPVEWIKCEKNWGKDGIGIWVFLIVFSIVVILLNWLLLQKRLKEI